LLQLAWPPLLASAVMGLWVWALRDWSLPLAVVVAPPLYGAALLAVRGFDREELTMLATAMPWKRR